jgi:hypothetical protein
MSFPLLGLPKVAKREHNGRFTASVEDVVEMVTKALADDDRDAVSVCSAVASWVRTFSGARNVLRHDAVYARLMRAFGVEADGRTPPPSPDVRMGLSDPFAAITTWRALFETLCAVWFDDQRKAVEYRGESPVDEISRPLRELDSYLGSGYTTDLWVLSWPVMQSVRNSIRTASLTTRDCRYVYRAIDRIEAWRSAGVHDFDYLHLCALAQLVAARAPTPQHGVVQPHENFDAIDRELGLYVKSIIDSRVSTGQDGDVGEDVLNHVRDLIRRGANPFSRVPRPEDLEYWDTPYHMVVSVLPRKGLRAENLARMMEALPDALYAAGCKYRNIQMRLSEVAGWSDPRPEDFDRLFRYRVYMLERMRERLDNDPYGLRFQFLVLVSRSESPQYQVLHAVRVFASVLTRVYHAVPGQPASWQRQRVLRGINEINAAAAALYRRMDELIDGHT